MKLKGDWNPLTSYSVEDVVRYTDGNVYHLQKPCAAGVTPVNTLYWGLVNQLTAEAVLLILDGIEIAESKDVKLANNLTTETAGKALDATKGKALKDAIDALNIPTNINDSAIVLKSSTASSEKEFIITVDDDGELTATEIVPETQEEAAEGGES